MNEPMRHTYGVPASRSAQSTLRDIVNDTRLQHAAMRAIESVTESAMFEVAAIKRVQREIEQAVPDAAEAINLIAATGCIAIARSVQRFGSELAG